MKSLASNPPRAASGKADGAHKRYKRGYVGDIPFDVQVQLKGFECTNLTASVGWAVLYLAVIVLAAGMAFGFMTAGGPVVGTIAYLLALLVITRQQRGLENMVHDASHRNWLRRNPYLNDLIADLLVGYPMMTTIEGYRASHIPGHHGQFGSESRDPCRARFERMGIGHLDLSSPGKVAMAVVRWLPTYNATYYQEIAGRSMRAALGFVVWHVVVFVLPLSLLYGFAGAFVLWVLFWMLPMLSSLPVARSIAEAEEHDYGRGNTEFSTTYTNEGWLHAALFHPFGDQYHLLHHMYPQVVSHHARSAHRLLMQHDEAYRRGLRRTSVLQVV